VTSADNAQADGPPLHFNDPSDTEFDANFDDGDSTIDNTASLTNTNPLDEEFHVIDAFVNSLIVTTPLRHRATTLAKADLPDKCLDMSTYCTQNAHGLWSQWTEMAIDSVTNHGTRPDSNISLPQ
jgi:hypothetical protein